MKILFYGDAHIRDYGSFPPFNQIDNTNGLTKELNNILQGFYFIADYIKDNEVDLVINLGDTFNSVDMITTKSIYVAETGLRKIKDACIEKGIEHIIIVGNHEILNESKNIHNCFALKGLCTEVVDEYMLYADKDIKLSLFPFTSNIIQARDWLEMAIEEKSNLIVTHLEFEGNRFDNGFPSSSRLPSKCPIPIVSGHIHLPQEVNNVINCGSLIQNKFSRPDLKDTGLMVYDTDTNKYKRVLNTYSKHYIKVPEESIGDMKYNPNNVVLQVCINDFDKKPEYEQKLKGYNYFFIKNYGQNNSSMDNVTYTDFKFSDPKTTLEEYIKRTNPEATDAFKEVFQ